VFCRGTERMYRQSAAHAEGNHTNRAFTGGLFMRKPSPSPPRRAWIGPCSRTAGRLPAASPTVPVAGSSAPTAIDNAETSTAVTASPARSVDFQRPLRSFLWSPMHQAQRLASASGHAVESLNLVSPDTRRPAAHASEQPGSRSRLSPPHEWDRAVRQQNEQAGDSAAFAREWRGSGSKFAAARPPHAPSLPTSPRSEASLKFIDVSLCVSRNAKQDELLPFRTRLHPKCQSSQHGRHC